MIGVDQIAGAVAAYLRRHPVDTPRIAMLSAGLARAGAGDITSRKTFTGHVTCSAIIVNPQREVLYIRHNILQAWLRPGGHLELDDTGLVDAAMREAEEETGIPADRLRLLDDVPADIDVHPVPANDAKGEPTHHHFDLAYAFAVTGQVDISLQTEEVHAHAWRPLAQITPTHLPTRVAHLLDGPLTGT